MNPILGHLNLCQNNSIGQTGHCAAEQAAPDDYYQNNFIEVFDFVLTHCKSLLPTELARALNQFLLADDDAQRLFARLLTRKARFLITP